jgi:hypothetical protein
VAVREKRKIVAAEIVYHGRVSKDGRAGVQQRLRTRMAAIMEQEMEVQEVV